MLLVELYIEEPLQQRCQSKRADSQQLRGNSRVEDVLDVPAVVLVQEPQVVVGIVEHDFDFRRLQQRTESFGYADRERIEDGAGLSGRDLQQVDPIDEAMEARSLGVERYGLRVRDAGDEAPDCFLSVEVKRWFLIFDSHAAGSGKREAGDGIFPSSRGTGNLAR
jgi:hypothetical protein